METTREEWLTVEEVGAALAVGPETVRRWIRAQELPALNLGGRKAGYRVRRASLERFIAERHSRRARPWSPVVYVCAGCDRQIEAPPVTVWSSLGHPRSVAALCGACQEDHTVCLRVAQEIAGGTDPGRHLVGDDDATAHGRATWPLTPEVLAGRLAVGGRYAIG